LESVVLKRPLEIPDLHNFITIDFDGHGAHNAIVPAQSQDLAGVAGPSPANFGRLIHELPEERHL
tara:strand:- start:351 stop:545 length:195 start_codon:yes stop_codon:yes gene_type:complete